MSLLKAQFATLSFLSLLFLGSTLQGLAQVSPLKVSATDPRGFARERIRSYVEEVESAGRRASGHASSGETISYWLYSHRFNPEFFENSARDLRSHLRAVEVAYQGTDRADADWHAYYNFGNAAVVAARAFIASADDEVAARVRRQGLIRNPGVTKSAVTAVMETRTRSVLGLLDDLETARDVVLRTRGARWGDSRIAIVEALRNAGDEIRSAANFDDWIHFRQFEKESGAWFASSYTFESRTRWVDRIRKHVAVKRPSMPETLNVPRHQVAATPVPTQQMDELLSAQSRLVQRDWATYFGSTREPAPSYVYDDWRPQRGTSINLQKDADSKLDQPAMWLTHQALAAITLYRPPKPGSSANAGVVPGSEQPETEELAGYLRFLGPVPLVASWISPKGWAGFVAHFSDGNAHEDMKRGFSSSAKSTAEGFKQFADNMNSTDGWAENLRSMLSLRPVFEMGYRYGESLDRATSAALRGDYQGARIAAVKLHGSSMDIATFLATAGFLRRFGTPGVHAANSVALFAKTPIEQAVRSGAFPRPMGRTNKPAVGGTGDGPIAVSRAGFQDYPKQTGKVLEYSKHGLTSHGYEIQKHPLDLGVDGWYYATHAERQVAIMRPNQPIWVSWPMCIDCPKWFRAHARRTGLVQVVTDPTGTFVFLPNGQMMPPLRPRVFGRNWIVPLK